MKKNGKSSMDINDKLQRAKKHFRKLTQDGMNANVALGQACDTFLVNPDQLVDAINQRTRRAS